MFVFVLAIFAIVFGVILLIYFKPLKVSRKSRTRKNGPYLRTGRGYIKRREGLIGDEIDNDHVAKKIIDTGLESSEK